MLLLRLTTQTVASGTGRYRLVAVLPPYILGRFSGASDDKPKTAHHFRLLSASYPRTGRSVLLPVKRNDLWFKMIRHEKKCFRNISTYAKYKNIYCALTVLNSNGFYVWCNFL